LEKAVVGKDEMLRIRSAWHDTPNGPFYAVSADYLVPSKNEPILRPSELAGQLDDYCIDGGHVQWFIRLQITLPQSDYYSPDDPGYYRRFSWPLTKNLKRQVELSELLEFDKWIDQAPFLIRTFNDQFMWERDMGKFGYDRSSGRTLKL
jgi:hypothetical protein